MPSSPRRRGPIVPELLIDAFEARRQAGQPLGRAAAGALDDVLEVAIGVRPVAGLVAPPGRKARRQRRPAPPARAPRRPAGPDPELERLAQLKRELDRK